MGHFSLWMGNKFSLSKVIRNHPRSKFSGPKWHSWTGNKYWLKETRTRGTTGCLKKKWDLFYTEYLHQTKHKSAGYIFHLKCKIHSSFGSVQKNSLRYQGAEIQANQNPIFKRMDIGQSKVLKSHVPYNFPFCSVSWSCTELALNMRHILECHL